MQAFAEGLKDNKSLKSLNLESNYVSGKCIVEILESIAVHKSVTELRVANQVSFHVKSFYSHLFDYEIYYRAGREPNMLYLSLTESDLDMTRKGRWGS